MYSQILSAIKKEKTRLQKTRISPSDEVNQILAKYGEALEINMTLADLLKRPGITYECIKDICRDLPWQVPTGGLPEFEIETEIKYEGYINRQLLQISQQDKLEKIKIPKDIDFTSMIHLSNEAREKFNKIKPITIGQASRIGGVSPADITVLITNIRQQQKQLELQNS